MSESVKDAGASTPLTAEVTDLKRMESIFCYCIYKYGTISFTNWRSLKHFDIKESFSSDHFIRLFGLMIARIEACMEKYRIESRLSVGLKGRPSPLYEARCPLITIYTSDKSLHPETSLFFGYMKPKDDEKSRDDMTYCLPMYSLLECELCLLTLIDSSSVFTGGQLYRSEIWDQEKYQFYKIQQREHILDQKYAESAPLFSTSFKNQIAAMFLARYKIRDNERKCLLNIRIVQINDEFLKTFKEYFPEIIIYENVDISKFSEYRSEGEVLMSNGCFLRIIKMEEDNQRVNLFLLAVNGSIRSIINSIYADNKEASDSVSISKHRFLTPSLYFLDSNIFEEVQKHALLSHLSLSDEQYKIQADQIQKTIAKYFNQLPKFLAILYSLGLDFQWCLRTARRKIWNKVTFHDFLVKNLQLSDYLLLRKMKRNLNLLLFNTKEDFNSHYGSIARTLLDALVAFSQQKMTKEKLRSVFWSEYEKLCSTICPTQLKSGSLNQAEVMQAFRNIEHHSLRVAVVLKDVKQIDTSLGEFRKLYNFLKFSFESSEELTARYKSSFEMALDEALDNDSLMNMSELTNTVSPRWVEIFRLNSDQEIMDKVEDTLKNYVAANKVLLQAEAKCGLEEYLSPFSISANYAKEMHFTRCHQLIFQHLLSQETDNTINLSTKDCLARAWSKNLTVPFDSCCISPIIGLSSVEFLEYLTGTCCFMNLDKQVLELFDLNDILKNLIYSLFASALFNFCEDVDWGPAYNYLKLNTFSE